MERKARTMEDALSILKEHSGVVFGSVIDVGVATGTPQLYAAFPSSYYYFIEPLKAFESNIQSHLRRLKGEHHPVAAGAANSKMQITVRPNSRPGGATMLKSEKNTGEAFSVEVMRLDNIIEVNQLSDYTILKTDCQGWDAAAIRGAEGLMPKISTIICEVVFNLPDNVESITDIIPYLRQAGFRLWDIVDFGLKQNGAISQADFIFLRMDLFGRINGIRKEF